MKKLLTVTLLLLCTLNLTFAQVAPTNPDATIEDYERYIDKRLEMNFRLSAMDAIGLTSDEIEAFSPVFDNYIKAKDRLSEKKFSILEEYTEEMEDEDDADDQAEETSDMIEDYWEAEIAEMELKKDYYDILEDKIPFQKAIDFFLYEETVENDMKYDILVPIMPSVAKIEKRKKDRKLKKMKAEKPQQVAAKDWNRYIDKRLEMNFRTAAIEEMYLTAEEIEVFNPLFNEYMDAKEEMTKKKFAILDKYTRKLERKNTVEKRTEKLSDFIEDYWEAEIKSMELKEKYFDKMENKLPYMKVAQFFLLEETVENRLKFDAMVSKMPTIIIIDQKMEKNRDGDQTDNTMSNDRSKTMSENTENTMKAAENKSTTAQQQMGTTGNVTEYHQNTTGSVSDKSMNTNDDLEIARNKSESVQPSKAGNGNDFDTRTETWNTNDNTTNSTSGSGNEKAGNKTTGSDDWDTKRSEPSKTTNEVKTSSTPNMGNAETNSVPNMDNKETNSSTPAKSVDKSEVNRPISTSIAFSNEITTFDNWVNTTSRQMSLDHDYTSNGLKALVAAIESTATATNTMVEGWSNKKAEILYVADQIQVDPKSTMHADWVHEAFVTAGDVVKTLNESNKYTYAHGQVSLLQSYANRINPDVLLMKQADVVYNFFGTANQALKDIWNYAAKPTATANTAAASSAGGNE